MGRELSRKSVSSPTHDGVRRDLGPVDIAARGAPSGRAWCSSRWLGVPRPRVGWGRWILRGGSYLRPLSHARSGSGDLRAGAGRVYRAYGQRDRPDRPPIDAALLGNGSAVVAWVGDFSPGRLTLVNAAGSRADALGSSTVRVAGLLRQGDGSLLLAETASTTSAFLRSTRPRCSWSATRPAGLWILGLGSMAWRVCRCPVPAGWPGAGERCCWSRVGGGWRRTWPRPNGVLGVARVTPGGTADSSFGVNGRDDDRFGALLMGGRVV